ncbi:hypothetical protein [Actinomycetospora sp. TBRC 11914]|uniref:hypothetical protein n=1 Tax=Actinomycetospora sp. TBRC 11914 TaxID=2729387 RepID=UPI00145F5CB3|nr:hypothetical protein [Actinomycetospora sp. TBRC 11914]NMO89978.1 hypothetical protein [Actinomycetospora sp. TBRC 11914]
MPQPRPAPAHPAPAPAAAGRRAVRRRPGGTDRAPQPAPLELPTAVVAGLQALGNLRDLPTGVLDGRLERMLRATLAHHRPPASPNGSAASPTEATSAAVLTACAHLATREYEDAYLALCTAYDHLPRHPAPPPRD